MHTLKVASSRMRRQLTARVYLTEKGRKHIQREVSQKETNKYRISNEI